jgi:surface protein
MESKYTNKYDNAYSILEKLEQGGSGGGKVVLVDGTKFASSTFTEIPENLDFSEVTDFNNMFRDCENLTTVPSLDTSNCTNFGNMFRYCENLTTVGNLDTSNGTNFSYMFNYCENLTSVPPLDTSKGTNFYDMFYYCKKLRSIPQLNMSNCTKFDNVNAMFNGCTALENISFVGSINHSLYFRNSSLLTYDSIKSILTAACAATTNTSYKTLEFNRTIADNNGELATLIGSCTDKGWTITGLTLE